MKDLSIHRSVSNYYTQKILTHGVNSRGVDWKDRRSQELRFDQLLRICDGQKDFSILDWGCGYGALWTYLKKRQRKFRYDGYDLSVEMIREARKRDRGKGRVCFRVGIPKGGRADYVVASGIFNVKLTTPKKDWLRYMLKTLADMDRLSREGFAFNCLTKYSDKERMRSDLYYADPLFLFDHCKRHFSRQVALLHDYGLYEFTILVRKNREAGK